VQIIGGFAILIWYVLALGQIFDSKVRADRGYWRIGLDAFAYWKVSTFAYSFAWPTMPHIGKIIFTFSVSGITAHYVITLLLPFFTAGFGIAKLKAQVLTTTKAVDEVTAVSKFYPLRRKS
jgi:hypothetical protein